MALEVLYHDTKQPHVPHSAILGMYINYDPDSILLGTSNVFYPKEIMKEIATATQNKIPVFGIMRKLLNGYDLHMEHDLESGDLQYNVDLDALNVGFIPLLGIPQEVIEARKAVHKCVKDIPENIRMIDLRTRLKPSEMEEFIFGGIAKAVRESESYEDTIRLARKYVSHPEFDERVDAKIEQARRDSNS